MKPIACVIDGKLMKYSNDPLPDECLLYPEREWVGLTLDELIKISKPFEGHLPEGWMKLTNAIEAALKDKNT